MKMPIELKPALMGAAAGAVALAILGFTWGGWVTAGNANVLAKQRAAEAVVTALAPVCVANFRLDKDSAAQLVELKKIRSWEQASFVEKHGWSTIPGTKTTDSVMARACAELILTEKTANELRSSVPTSHRELPHWTHRAPYLIGARRRNK